MIGLAGQGRPLVATVAHARRGTQRASTAKSPTGKRLLLFPGPVEPDAAGHDALHARRRDHT